MGTGIDLLKALKKVDLTRLTSDAMKKHKEEIVALNKEQMYYGKLSNGRDIAPPYSPLTVNEKLKKGQPYDRVTLEDTGKFKRGMNMKVTREYYEMYSTDPKQIKLIEQYSAEIFGLSLSGKKEAWLIVLPDVVNGIKKVTGL